MSCMEMLSLWLVEVLLHMSILEGEGADYGAEQREEGEKRRVSNVEEVIPIKSTFTLQPLLLEQNT